MIISDPRQAAMFGHPMRGRILLWCARQARSLTELKAKFGLSLSKLHYHTGQLVEAGLLTVERTQPRGGRPIRFYRAVAEEFAIPQEHLPAGPSEKWSLELRRSLSDAANRAEGLTATYGADADGNLMVRMLPPGPGRGAPRVRELWKVVPLDAQQRIDLAREMAELLNRYAQPAARPGAELYWVHAAFAPRRGPAG